MPNERTTRHSAIPGVDWMNEQLRRAEAEAEAWRRLRAEIDAESLRADVHTESEAPAAPRPSVRRAILHAAIRFAIAAFGAYLGYLAAIDASLGEFEVWMIVGAAFSIALALTVTAVGRRYVVLMAETSPWLAIFGTSIAIATLPGIDWFYPFIAGLALAILFFRFRD